MPLDLLTWHRGSVLPYASLWHTLQRAAALNALRSRELYGAGAQSDVASGSGIPSRANLLFNDTNVRDAMQAVPLEDFARALGEPLSVFDWSHLGKLPIAFRFLVRNEFRVCPSCLASGFHSAFLSLRLLQACPIHGCGLFRRCVCGRSFTPFLTTTMLRDRGYCACGRMRIFTRQTCRRPTMSVAETHPLSPIAEWLNRLTTVGIPWDTADLGHRPAQNQTWTRDLERWCLELDLGYPECFVRAPRPRERLVAVRHDCGMRPERRFRKPVLEAFKRRFWANDPAAAVYRCFARYLRRHVTRGTSCLVQRMLMNPDPIAIAELIRSDRRALVGFAEFAWALSIEPEVIERRWPNRQLDDAQWRMGEVSVSRLHPSIRLDDASHRWVRYHAGESLVLSQWIAAQRQACFAALMGVATWRVDAWTEEQNWSIRQSSDGLRLVALHAEAAYNWTLPLPDKQRRRALALDQDRARLTEIQAQCRGPCLSWSASCGWCVDEAITPQELPIARHRLLGVGAEHPRFWLFQAGGFFVARACELRLQTRGFSPQEAIDSLRSAVRQHRSRYPAQPQPSVRLTHITPLIDSGLVQYQQQVSCIVHDQGLRGGARMAHEAALSYLADRGKRQAEAFNASWP